MVPSITSSRSSCCLCENNFSFLNFFSFNFVNSNIKLYYNANNAINNYTYNSNSNALAGNCKKNHKKCGKLGRRCSSISGGARVSSRWRLHATADVRVIESSRSGSGTGNASSQAPVTPTVDIPVSCYQILGVPHKAEKDEIVKSVMHLRNAEIEEGYTMDTVVSRQNFLLDVRDKLLFEPEYAGNVKGKVPPKSSLLIPWAWLPGALCILQEVGEEKLVLDIGRKALQHPDSKPYIHDLLLSMALAECAIAKAGFEKNKISQGFEALARAQCLLRSKVSLGKMTLLSQIEESLEELAPACTLELLGMPHSPDHAERRLGAIAALRELLRQGLDVETSCQVEDWPCFLIQALTKLMAAEIVELLPWDSLALTRKTKKSLESQNQRVVIDFNSFYIVLIAHIALGFSSKQIDLINKAKTICECLIASEGIDLKFEEAFCLFLLGQGDEATAIERLKQLESNSSPASRKLSPGRDITDLPGANKSLETWLKDSVLGLFSDTRDCSPSLVNFFSAEKRASWNRQNKRAPPAMSNMKHRPLAPDIVSDSKAYDEYRDTSRHLGLAVKQLAPPDLQKPLVASKEDAVSNTSTPSVQLKRNLGARQSKVWEIWSSSSNMIVKIIFVTSLGCILFGCFRLMNMEMWRMGNGSKSKLRNSNTATTSSWHTASSLSQSLRPSSIGNRLARRLENLLSMQGNHAPKTADFLASSVSSGSPSSLAATYKQSMPVEEAETLVKKWQATKAEALGPNHHVDGLFDILDESMLEQWQGLANEAKARSCFWRFVLLQLSVLKVDTLINATGEEIAEIVVLLEEAAELVDESQPKNPNYYSAYKIHYVLKKQYDGSWRFCEADIHSPS